MTNSLVTTSTSATEDGQDLRVPPRRIVRVTKPTFSPETILRLIVALTWLFWSSRFYVVTYRFPGATFLTVAYGMGAIVAFAAPLISPSRRLLRRLDAVLLIGAVIGLMLWVVSLVYQSSAYGTDEAAFTQGAAQLLLHGHNPYGADLSGFLQIYGVSPGSWTTKLSGGYVHDLGYPALSFLFTVPLLAIGVTTQAQIWVNAAFFCVGATVLWFRLPRRMRNVVPLLLAFDAYGSAVSGGLIFGLAMPFAVLAVVGWDRFGVAGQPLMVRRLGPVFLGLACAVRQDLWILVPFLAMGVAQEARANGGPAVRRATSYLALVAGGLLAPNLPFIVWDPLAWLRGVLSPVLHGLVPLGQGAIGLSLYVGAGGGNLQLYSALVGLLIVTLALAMFLGYARLKPVLPLVPALALFVSTRSLAQYLLFGMVVAVAAAATIDRARVMVPLARRSRRVIALDTAIVTGLTAGTLTAALTDPSPLNLSIISVHTTGQQGSVDELTVSVHNASSHQLSPHFIVGGGPYVGLPWFADAGSPGFHIAPGADAVYRLRAPDVTSMPSINGGFKVDAFTSSPSSVSSSDVVTLGDMFTRLMPNATDRIVPAGQPLDLTVQLIDRFGRAIPRAGVPIAIGQAEYTPAGLFAGETIINGGRVGASPEIAMTDPQGVAHFTVLAPRPISREVFFQAWVAQGAPSGYSKQLSVWFG
jgi:uncharacterized membrane protein